MKRKVSCPTTTEITAFLGEELSAEQAEAVRKHIEACKKCATQLLISRMFQSLGKHRSMVASKSPDHSCIDVTILSDFVSGKSMAKSTRNQVVEHLAQCNSCRLKSVKLFQEYSDLVVEGQAFMIDAFDSMGKSRANWLTQIFSHIHNLFPYFKTLRWAITVVAILFFTTMTIFIIQKSNKDADIWIKSVKTLRETGDSSARRFILKKPDNGQVLKKNEFIHFNWPKVPGTKKYHILMYSMNGDLIWGFSTESTSAIFEQAGLLQSGKSYFWQVEAITVAGKPLFSEMRIFAVN